MRVVLPVLVVLLTACRTPPAAAARYPITGQILSVQLDTRQVLLKHEAIPGYMDAMTMPFVVADAAAIRDRRPGDVVRATLVVEAERSYLEALVATGTAPLPAEAAVPAANKGVAILLPGDAVPDTALVDQRGRPFSLAGWRGKAGAITFIYTRCPLPDYCPLLDRRFAEVEAAMRADAALREHVALLSVSFDPARDTPEVLAQHAKALDAGPAWTFATAPADTVDRFAAAFGVNVIREADTTITHNLRTAVVDPAGRLVSVRSGNDFTADDLLTDLRRALGAPPAASTP